MAPGLRSNQATPGTEIRLPLCCYEHRKAKDGDMLEVTFGRSVERTIRVSVPCTSGLLMS